jgi:hypothetical protein
MTNPDVPNADVTNPDMTNPDGTNPDGTNPDRPLLFLDVDGTLLPIGQVRSPTTPQGWIDWQTPSNPRLIYLDRAHGPRLRNLPCDLIWATAWMESANEVIAPLLGLPELPVADIPEPPPDDDGLFVNIHWKTRALVHIAAGRPFAWVDDEIGESDRIWVAAHHPGQALLHRVDATLGLTEKDLAEIDTWLRSVSTAS